MKNLFAFLCIGIFSCAAHLSAMSLDVDPTVVEISVDPGGSFSGTLNLSNLNKKSQSVRARLSDWQYEAPNGAKKLLPPGSTERSCANWLKLTKNRFTLSANQTEELRYSISVPPDATGGYYGALLFSGDDEQAKAEGGISININLEVSVLFLVTIKGTEKYQGEITNFSARQAAPSQPVTVKARFKNSGNLRINAQGRLAIMDANNNAVGWTQFPPIKTLPGNAWEVETEWAAPATGKYHLVGTFELAPGTLLIQEQDVQVQ